MRISKDLAGQIAYKLTEKTRIAMDAVKKEYGLLATEMYEATIPEAIKAAHKKHPEWFYSRGTMHFSGHGFNFERVTTERQVICNSGTDANLTLTAKTATTLMAAKRKYEKAEAEYKALKKETETAFINLGTYARIREHIPAAAPMLPPPMSNALVCNFDSLNKRLEKQLSDKKTVNQ